MKICESWLREWVEYDLDADALAHRLTMLGLEVESVSRVSPPLSNIVVGRVLEVLRHPTAEKLSLCRVDVAQGEPLGIVCGARNVRAGGLYPTALVGAVLPGGPIIKAVSVRGQSSAGMLCSAAELGLEPGTDGLLELDASAEVGADVHRTLQLDDSVLDVNVTPNRADCFSVAGIAREVSAIGDARLHEPRIDAVPAAGAHTFPVTVVDAVDCPRLAGRVIRSLRTGSITPLWMRERLRRCGVRSIHPVVDVTNYVMLELGQPMHSYDLSRLTGGITVRHGRPGESVALLDGQEVRPSRDVLVIADEKKVVGLAGIMGGLATAVTAETRDIFLESAFFASAAVIGRARQLGIHTDASLRFERGVDPALQARAIERATALIRDIAGGSPGPVIDIVSPKALPVKSPIGLRRRRLNGVLGTTIAEADVVQILQRLRMKVAPQEEGWEVTAPSARFDIEREEDLIEEVARVYGYDRIPAEAGRAEVHAAPAWETTEGIARVGTTLVARGYQEAITYSFIDPALSRNFGGEEHAGLILSNPISSEMSVMRQSLWPGLVSSARANLNRQQRRVRLFEIGTRFTARAGAADAAEEIYIAGVALGDRLPEQWGAKAEAVGVFDVKADVEALLSLTGRRDQFRFEPAAHPALHPGRCGRILMRECAVGWLGEVHPAIVRQMDLPGGILFEISAVAVLEGRQPGFNPVSLLPSVRRDIAVVVSRDVPAAALLTAVRRSAPAVLRDAFIFDIYTGQQVGKLEKSVAIGLILQDTSRTLTDEDADGVLQIVTTALAREFQARIRE